MVWAYRSELCATFLRASVIMQYNLVPCGREGNRRSGVALAMHHILQLLKAYGFMGDGTLYNVIFLKSSVTWHHLWYFNPHHHYFKPCEMRAVLMHGSSFCVLFTPVILAKMAELNMNQLWF